MLAVLQRGVQCGPAASAGRRRSLQPRRGRERCTVEHGSGAGAVACEGPFASPEPVYPSTRPRKPRR